MRHCRMFSRFREFAGADPLTRNDPLFITGVLIGRWILDLVNHRVGRYTPNAAAGCAQYFATVLDFMYDGVPRSIRDLSNRYISEPGKEIMRAPRFTVKVLTWLEDMVLGKITANPVDRLVCGRARLMSQASVRAGDARRTPVSRTSWLVNNDQSIRGLITRSAETKTFPRHWIASRLAVVETNDG